MTDAIKFKLIDLFWEGIEGMHWDTWCDTSSGDKERVAVAAMAELGEEADQEEVYDLFWEWAEGLDEESFESFDDEALEEVE